MTVAKKSSKVVEKTKVNTSKTKRAIKTLTDEPLESLAEISQLPRLLKNKENKWQYESPEEGLAAIHITLNCKFDIQEFDLWLRKLTNQEQQSYFIKMRLELSELFKDLLASKENQEIKFLKQRLLAANVEVLHQSSYGLRQYNYLLPLTKKTIEVLSNNGKKGAAKRHEPTMKIKEFALGEYKKNKYKSMRHGAKSIEKVVCEFAKELKHPLSESQAHGTIYKWIRDSEKYYV